MSPPLRPLILWLLLCRAPAQEPGVLPQVQTFAGPEMAGQTIALATDDSGRLYLSCTQRWLRDAVNPDAGESAVCLTDRDRDGRADVRTVIADGFNAARDGPAGGILPLRGGVLFGCSPSLWRLVDDNADLRSDRRLPLLTGFGVRSGTSLPGLRAITEGPDGWIYFTAAARGCHVPAVEGPRYVIPDSGAVFRCRPDGEDLELLATGLHDPAGIVVDGRGRIFVADAAPDQQFTRLLQVLPGADFGWNKNLPERDVFKEGVRPSWMLPELAVINRRATGLVIAPVLQDIARLPVLLMADGRSDGGVVPLTLTANETAFAVTVGTPLWQGTAQGLATGPDGAVFWADWGSGIAADASSRICRLPPGEGAEAWSEAAALLAAPLPANNLPALLEHGLPLVRRRAREALAARGFVEALDPFTRTAKRSPSMPARLNALWGLATLARSEPMLLNEVLLLFTSAEPDIRALAVRIAGEVPGDVPAGGLVAMLRDTSPDVRIEAAVAVARLRPAGSAEALATAMTASADDEPALRHALTYALSCVLTPAELAALGTGTSALRVKTAAVHALRRHRAAELAAFLDSAEPAIIAAAAEAISDGAVTPAFPALAASLSQCAAHPELIQPGFVRRGLAAAYYCGTPEAVGAVAGIAALPAEALSPELRAAVLTTLARWDVKPQENPVPGSPDSPLPRPWGIARPHLLRLQPDIMASQPGVDKLAAAVGNNELSSAAHIDALQQLAAAQPARALEICRGMMPGRGTAALRASARTIIMRLDGDSSYGQINEALAAGSPQEMQAVLVLAQRFDSKQSDAFWLELGRKFLAGLIAPEARLEVLEGLSRRDVATRGKFRRLLETVDAAYDEETDQLARWRICETGGDPDKGRIVFETGLQANCTACHSLRGHGGTTAPELDGVASRLNRGQLLAALVRPSARIATGYGEVTVALQDGVSHHGILRYRDDATLLLATDKGARRLNAGAVTSLSQPVSPMPSMSTILTPREIRDLVAWLETLK